MATPSRKRRILPAACAALVVLLPLGYSLGSYLAASGHDPAALFLEQPDPRHTACVRDVTYMRFHHMELLKELRDAGVREGARREISLSSCRDCHASREGFCTRCHSAVNLSPDCFDCHDYP